MIERKRAATALIAMESFRDVVAISGLGMLLQVDPTASTSSRKSICRHAYMHPSACYS
jgi:hypothetical protein